jgi:hypothetical protein
VAFHEHELRFSHRNEAIDKGLGLGGHAIDIQWGCQHEGVCSIALFEQVFLIVLDNAGARSFDPTGVAPQARFDLLAVKEYLLHGSSGRYGSFDESFLQKVRVTLLSEGTSIDYQNVHKI